MAIYVVSRRCVSTLASYRLTSRDVYSNLAFETWMHENTDWKRQSALLFWYNEPCVVIGSHQNPWIECNLEMMQRDNVKLARRRSGGGAVFHDGGNLNITFMTSRENHDPEMNASVISDVLRNSFGLENDVLPRRSDIFIDGKKVSGSAFRLTGNGAYHHCTLLLRTDARQISTYLSSNMANNIETQAIASVRSPVTTLSRVTNTEIHNQLEHLPDLIAEEYWKRTQAQVLVTHRQDANQLKTPWRTQVSRLKSWTWRYGHSPRMVYTPQVSFDWGTVRATIESKKGIVQQFHIDINEEGNSSWSVNLKHGNELTKDSTLPRLDALKRHIPMHMYTAFVAWCESWPLWIQP
eukprot:gene436-3774_t